MPEKLKGQKTLLMEALRDISRELNSLNREKQKLDKKLDTVKKEAVSTWELEKGLKDKLDDIMNKESDLTRKKNLTENKLTNLKEKINKVKRAQQELSS